MATVKLEGDDGERVYASGHRTVYTTDGVHQFQKICCLPGFDFQIGSLRRSLQTDYRIKSVLLALFGAYPTTNVWPVEAGQLYVTRGNRLFRSRDRGETWRLVRRLPPSSGPMGVLPTGFCAVDGKLYIGEYPLDRSAQPRVLRSSDDGDTWTTVAAPDSRHVHAVTVDPFTGDRWVTTGDADDESMIGRLSGDGIEVVGTGSQLWRAVDLAFTPDAVLWGMDCPYREENRIVRLDRDQIGTSDPTVETLHSVSSPIYFAETLAIDGEQHVFFSTAIEPATAPDHVASVVHGSTADGFDKWQTLVRYSHSNPLLAGIVDTNAYVFLTAHSEQGLFVNPYNTKVDNGKIKKIPSSYLQYALGRGLEMPYQR